MKAPMNDPMSCERFTERLPDFLEREVPETTRAAMEAHALSCRDCGPLLADLRRLRIDAANLPELAPSRDLWNGISARIETPVVELPGRNDSASIVRQGRFARRVWIGLAAAGLVAVTATITHEVTKRSIGTTQTVAAISRPAHDTAPTATLYSPATTATTATTLPTVASNTAATATRDSVKPATTRSPAKSAASTRLASNTKPSAEATYDSEIAKLRAVLSYRRRDLDSATVAVVDKNLEIIDDAIAQCRLALQKDPASRYLMQSLNDALDSKVQLLRTAATLPPRA
jgi:putative zinc finger protein